MDTKKTLEAFIEKYDNKYIQRSKEWYEKRKKTVGGSEISTLLGKNYFKSINDLFLIKVANYLEDPTVVAQFTGNFATNWGTNFEEVIEEYVKFNNDIEKVYGENMFIYDDGSPMSYSPDGLAIIDGEIVLLEFKCPISNASIVKPPINYEMQVKYGLCKIDIAKYGLLCTGKYRRCSAKQAMMKTGVHAEDRPVKNLQNLQYGIMGWKNSKFGDFSSVGTTEFREKFMIMINEYGAPQKVIGDFNENCEPISTNMPNEISAGTYFYWKLVSYSEIIIERNPQFANDHLQTIQEFTDDVNTFIENVDARNELLQKYMYYYDGDIEEIE